MLNFDSYRTVLFLLLAGLLCGTAQAQTAVRTATSTTQGTLSLAASSDQAPDTARTPLQLSQPPAPAATAPYYDSSHKDLRQSLAWMQETNAQAPTYWNLYTEARIRLQLQDYAGARTTAEQAYQLALKAMPVSQEYVALSAAVVTRAHKLTKP